MQGSGENSDIKKRLRAYSDKKKPEIKETTSPTTSLDRKKSSSSPEAIKEDSIEEDKTALSNMPEASEKTEGKEIDYSKMDVADLARMIQALTTDVRELKNDVAGIKTSKSSYDSLQTQIQDEKIKRERVEQQFNSDSYKLKMLTAIVIRQDQRIESLTKELNMVKRSQRKANIYIGGLLESDAEETQYQRIELVKTFLKTQVEISQEIKILQAFRQGQGNPRNMCVVLANPDDKYLILTNSSTLKGKTNARKKLFRVSEDLIEEDKELRSYMLDLRRENKSREDEDKLKINIRKGKLFVNNECVKPKVEIPSAADMLTMDFNEINAIEDMCLHQAKSHEEGESEFMGFYQRVKSEAEVQKGYAKMKLRYGDATHVVAAYKLQDAIGPYKQAYIDDGEPGAGRAVLKELKSADCENVAVYVIRYFGGQNLGSRRFEVYADIAKDAIKRIKNKLERLERANRLRRSNSQLSQLSITSMMDEEEFPTPDPGTRVEEIVQS